MFSLIDKDRQCLMDTSSGLISLYVRRFGGVDEGIQVFLKHVMSLVGVLDGLN
jgi:hypothetical protein